MPISERELKDLVAAGVIDAGTAERIAAHFKGAGVEPPRFDLTHTAYCLGALVVMSALGWFMNEAWARYGGWVLTLIAVAYAVAFTVAGESLWGKPGLRQPGGLLFTLAVWMTPLAVFGIQYALGWWPREARASYQEYYPQISGSWVVMEAATIVAAAVALKLRPFPFLTFPLAFALWFLSLDLAALLIESHGLVAFEQKQLITLLFGATVLGVTYLLDRRTDQDYAFWLYLFGLVAFWGALTYDGVGSITYCLINLGLMLVAVLLQRKTFMVFGAIGVYSYLGHLAFDVFRNSLLFPAALTALGAVHRERRLPLGHGTDHDQPGRVFRPRRDGALRLRRHHDADRLAVRPHERRDARLFRGRRLVEPGAHVHRHHEIGRHAPRGVEAQHRPQPAFAQSPSADRLRRKIQRQRAGGVEDVYQRGGIAQLNGC